MTETSIADKRGYEVTQDGNSKEGRGAGEKDAK